MSLPIRPAAPALEAAPVFADACRRLAYDTTLRVLDRHVPPRSSLLHLGLEGAEVALHLARHGHQILAADADPEGVNRWLQAVEAEGLGNLQVRQADPARLEALSDWDFQAVLCFGPYESLRTRERRRRCLMECRRVVHDRGLVALTYRNRAFSAADQLRRGVVPSADQWTAWTSHEDPAAHLEVATTPEAVEAEVRSCGFEILEHLGLDGLYGLIPEALDRLDADQYGQVLARHLETCGQPSTRGASAHGLVILKKR